LIPKTVAKMIAALDEKKAVDISLLNMSDVVNYTDYILICTGTSTTHIGALVDTVEESVQKELKPIYQNRAKDKSWLILDYGEIVVHVFSESARIFYDLERLWGDAKKLDWSKMVETAKS
jgi:ribosome-associated protein